jgi:integrase
MYNEAINYGWVDRNPAAEVRPLRVHIMRKRLSIEQWKMMCTESSTGRWPPWVPHMMMLALVTGQRRADLQKMKFDDVWDGHLHVEQQKTGERIALPLALRLSAIGISLGEAIDACRDYTRPGETLLRKHSGQPLVANTLTARFESLRESVCGPAKNWRTEPSLQECRSLSERLYRAQGIDTRTLLGHRKQAMTDMYNDDRGLTRGQWRTLKLSD